jgi:hypothetical protein
MRMAARPSAQRGEKNFCRMICCVTTRGRNVRVLNGLVRGLGSLTALLLRLGMALFGCVIPAMPGLAPRRLPTPPWR